MITMNISPLTLNRIPEPVVTGRAQRKTIINTLRLEKNGRHFTDGIFSQIFLKEYFLYIDSTFIDDHSKWSNCPCVSTGSCITAAIWRCRKNFSQSQRSFQWKLRSHWLKFLRQRYVALVKKGPGPVNGLASNNRQAITWIDGDQFLWRGMASLGRNELDIVHLDQTGGNITDDIVCHQAITCPSGNNIFEDAIVSPWTRWQPFGKRYILVHFCEWKLWYFD